MKRNLVILIGVLMLVVLLALMAVNGAVASSALPIYGDANGDHAVNMGDVTAIERQILSLSPLTPGADANQNGAVNIGDITWVELQILELRPIYGDADGNQMVNQADIGKVERIIMGLDSPTASADANMDGKINMVDVTTIELMTN